MPFEAKMDVLRLLATNKQNTTATIIPLLEDTLGVGTRAKTGSNYVSKRRQDPGDLGTVTQKLTSDMSGKDKSPCLNRELQVTTPEVSIRKILVS